jgi:DNA polymerase-3 subunit gamma/tau
VSLYRTWRPRTFADLVGQDAVVKTLTSALETGRLAHAYLFSGPRGSGKTSAAKILARCIECVNGPTAYPDNTCENCRAIIEGTALDVLEIDAASNRGIDEIRALRDAVKFAPSAMRKKVYIIDEAHMLTKEGANAFLKTLEEPPEWAVFILATTAPEALPPTILSRCQRYAFRRIAIPTMIARMREIAGAEGIPIDDAALGAIAYRADGGLRDALTMLEQVAAFANGPVDVAVVEDAFGQTGRAFARALRDAALDGQAAEALRIVDEASDAGADMTGLIRSAIEEFRHLLVARVNPELLARDLAEDDAHAARERAAATPQPRLVRALRLLADALAAARGSGNARLELESALLRFLLQGEDPSLDALAARVAALESGAPATRPAASAPASQSSASVSPLPASSASAGERRGARVETQSAEIPARPQPASRQPAERAQPAEESTAPAASSAATPVAPAAAREAPKAPAANGGELTVQKVRSLWASVRTRAEGEKPSLRATLSRTTVAALEGGVLALRVPDAIAAEVLRREVPTLRKAIEDVTGRAVDVRVTVAASAPPPETGVSDDGGEDAEDGDDLMRYALEKLT